MSAASADDEPGRYFLIVLRGEWDLYNRPAVEAALLAGEASGERLVAIAVVAEDDQIRKVFEITGLDYVFALHRTLEEPQASLRLA